MAGIVEKLQKMCYPPDDEYDEYYEDEATEPTADSREEQPSARRSFSSSSSNRVVNINHARAGAQVVVFSRTLSVTTQIALRMRSTRAIRSL